MKKSKAVPLIVLGTIALAGCGPDYDNVEVKQSLYNTVEECRKDWGSDDRDCKSNGSGGYAGPRYFWSHSGGYPMAVNPDGTTRQLSNSYLSKPGQSSAARSTTSSTQSVSRSSSFRSGGFGGTSRGFSSGG